MKFPIEYKISGCEPGDDGGTFKIFFEGMDLFVIASNGLGWEHVSVSLKNRCPNWKEMSFVKDLFWDEDQVVMQLHPAKKNHINIHDHCLHLWRPIDETIPLPPKFLV
jgi:hypothetical protein